jgi:hypothetical protein
MAKSGKNAKGKTAATGSYRVVSKVGGRLILPPHTAASSAQHNAKTGEASSSIAKFSDAPWLAASAALLGSTLSPRGYADTAQRPPAPVHSRSMVNARLETKLRELQQRGLLLDTPRVDHITVNGTHFIEVRAYTPWETWRDEEARERLFDEIEATGDSTVHVQAHIYRRRTG